MRVTQSSLGCVKQFGDVGPVRLETLVLTDPRLAHVGDALRHGRERSGDEAVSQLKQQRPDFIN